MSAWMPWVRPFQAEGGDVGVDAVGAADAGRVLEFEGAALEDLLEGLEVLEEDFIGLLEEVAVGGVHDVGGGEPVMDPLALGAEAFADGAGEGHHVVAGDFFDFLDAVHVEGGRGADLFDVFLRDDAQFAPGFAGEDFDFEVRLELVLLGPDVPHHLAGVTFDHRLFRNVSMFFSMRAAGSASSALTKGTPVMCSYSSM